MVPPHSEESGHLERLDFEGTRGLRYAELFTVGPEFITIYNTTGLGDAPQEQWEALEPAAAARELKVQAVIKNGPRWWAFDRATLEFGIDEISVGGMRFRFAAKVPAFLAKSGSLEPPVYTLVDAHKTGTLLYRAGKPLHELVSPEGDVFEMQASTVDPGDWPSMANRLTPVRGWRYRTRTLSQDLTVELGGTVKVVMDDLRNVFNLAPNAR